MSWLYSRALVGEFWEESFSDGEPSAPSNLTPTPLAYWSHGKTTAHSRLSRFGMTLERLTDDRGEELLTWYQAGFRARTSAQPVKAQALTANAADYGESLRGFLGRFDPDTHSLKTAQCSLVEDSTLSLQTLPRWGSMRAGELYQQQTPARLTSAKESGLWLTPTAHDARPITGGNLYETRTGTVRHMRPDGKSSNRGLNAQVTWPTPTVVTATGGASMSKWGGSYARAKLRTMTTPEEINGALNPTWVEWLMNWPMGWTSLGPLPVAQFEEWQRQINDATWWDTDPSETGVVGRIALEIASRVDRLRALGNGQVSAVARLAWELLTR